MGRSQLGACQPVVAASGYKAAAGARYGFEQFQLPRISAGEASLDATDEVFNGMRRVATESLRQPPQQRQV